MDEAAANYSSCIRNGRIGFSGGLGELRQAFSIAGRLTFTCWCLQREESRDDGSKGASDKQHVAANCRVNELAVDKCPERYPHQVHNICATVSAIARSTE